ncbi:hypothetical protein [Sulfurimonas sp.]|uniref:hypothetical protein n=1 Tax=Sulfurimonas sp. TaxID=2022749 RepID=UPI002604A0A7|nr:hypothetical protein [Sulfurimonas sp.]
MNGKIMVTYKILCKADLNKEIKVEELLANEKIAKIIKSEYAKGFRNIVLLSDNKEAKIKLETLKDLHTFEVDKNDFADILVLAEEHATLNKLIKKDCERIELMDIETV